MFGLLKLELKKLYKCKKLIWLLIVVIIASVGIYYQNVSQYYDVRNDVLYKVEEELEISVGYLQSDLITLKREGEYQEHHAKKYDLTQEMLRDLMFWRIALENHWSRALNSGDFDDFLAYEEGFYNSLLKYQELGGGSLEYFQGTEKDMAIEKNAWLIENNIFYEDEKYPNSPHLNLVHISAFLFGIAGVLILVYLFGTGITDEKKEGTWYTLKTQPVPPWKIIVSKYISLFVITVVFLIMVMTVGLIIPAIFSDYSINLNYPQVLKTGESFLIVSTSMYLLRASFLFIFVSLFSFSIAMVLNRLCKNSLTTLACTSAVLLSGYFLTDWISLLQHPINPFSYFYYDTLSRIPSSSDLLYPLVMGGWSMLCVFLAIYLPQKQISLFNTSNFKHPFSKGKTRRFQSSFWSLYVFEWRKIFRKGWLLKAFGLLFILIIFLYSTLSQLSLETEKAYINNLENEISRLENDVIPDMEERLEDQPSLETTIMNLNNRIQKKEEAIEGYYSGNWTPLYDYQIFNLTSKGDAFSHPTQFTIETGVEEVQLMMENDISPIFIPQHKAKNIFQEDNYQWYQNQNRTISSDGLFTFNHYFEEYIYFIPLSTFLFLLGGGFASERGKKPTFNFLKGQPIKTNKLFLGKVLSGISTVVLCCVVFFLVVVLFSTIANQFGDWNYPILRYDSEPVVCQDNYTGTEVFVAGWNRGFHFVNLGRHLVESIGLFFSITLFLISIINLLALAIKSKTGIFTLTLGINAGGYALSQFLGSTAHLSPFIYLNIPKVVSGEFATLMNNPKINLWTGNVLLLTLTAALVIVGYNISVQSNKG
ncbi:ABC transporter permease subunit [Proteinivorax tanatarense]|uniref:ABC transporter permease subunit n=1 Tax=Proteinivorax tanatarense TaxID=1260629 RepID=A0AAU7VIW4_9FIRM